MTTHRPAVFIDRDGTLNKMVRSADGRLDSPLHASELVLERHATSFVRALNQLGYLCVVVTNQPGLAKGTLTQRRLARIHEQLRDDLASAGAVLDGIYYCPHHPDPGPGGNPRYTGDCSCRKPAPGLLLEAAVARGVNLQRSFMVGDRLVDVEAGRRAGVSTILVRRPDANLQAEFERQPNARPDRYADDLAQALEIIAERREEAIAHRG